MPELLTFLFDDASAGRQRLLNFGSPGEVIEAPLPQEVPAALASGHHVAGWMSYELGYELEPRLTPLQWRAG